MEKPAASPAALPEPAAAESGAAAVDEEAALFDPFGGREQYERLVAQHLCVSVASVGLAAQQAGAGFRLVHPRQYGAMLRRRAALDVRARACRRSRRRRA
jgi:hypothetical protein